MMLAWRGTSGRRVERRSFETVAPATAPYLEALAKFTFGGSDVSAPNAPVPVIARSGADYHARERASGDVARPLDGAARDRRPARALRPDLGPRASPFTFTGPSRFYPPPLPLAEVPSVDAVLISHDHYDHLDMFRCAPWQPGCGSSSR
jgi:hypothetical protein